MQCSKIIYDSINFQDLWASHRKYDGLIHSLIVNNWLGSQNRRSLEALLMCG